MNKRKIMTLALSLCMVAILAIGGTLAFFTDTATQTNVFTIGDVKIELEEQFPDNLLKPGENNALQKEVTVKNTGSEDAYMWIELWIPADLDTPGNAGENDLHFNPFDTYDVDGVPTPMRGKVAQAAGYKLIAETVEVALGSKEINGVTYNGYREYIKNDTPKAKNESTYALLARVFMDQKVAQCEDAAHADGCMVLRDGAHYTGSWEIIVNAYGIQADGFANIEEAIASYDGKVL